jgi:uncharacterized protein (DUF736 family)
MIIGKFTQTKSGYAGNLVTLTHRGKLVFTANPKGADFTVTLDGHEVGAGWKKTSREKGTAYVSVRLDSPFLAAPVNCALMAQEEGDFILVWSRDDRKQD